ncbi:pyridoxal phosphate-dependent aminotransferase [Candidatus Wolfebacteria bacterium]|nr:pyridoxal phosphate-dependent aminotransferase [Candidatus Wolfebacteria bacterium]
MNIENPSFFIGKGDNDGFISFGSGQPDLPPPKEVYDILPDYRSFKYGLIQGQANLREALAKQYPNANPDNFVITNGASEAIDLALRALYQPGAKIFLPKPYYYSYPHNVYLARMEPVYYELENGKINFETFKKDIQNCRIVLINSPSNPTGTIQDLDVLKKIEKLAQDLGIYIISDEVYKDLIYERENYLLENGNVLTVNSFSKTFAMCGFRVGYLYAREKAIIKKVIDMKNHTSMNTNILGQEMAYEATKVPRSRIEAQTKIWKERRDLIYNGLRDLGLDLWKPEGAFYVFPKMKNPSKVVSDLYCKYKMIVYNGVWFGDSERVRFSYALDAEKITEGLKRLKEYLSKEYKEN